MRYLVVVLIIILFIHEEVTTHTLNDNLESTKEEISYMYGNFYEELNELKLHRPDRFYEIERRLETLENELEKISSKNS